MRLGTFAPVVCVLAVTACAANAISDALTSGQWPSNELPVTRLHVGFWLTGISCALIAWLVLDAPRPARDWAKAALALLAVGTALWHAIVWPSFWFSLGPDDCVTNCIGPQHIAARLDVVQGKWGIAAANCAAAFCVIAAGFTRTHAARG